MCQTSEFSSCCFCVHQGKMSPYWERITLLLMNLVSIFSSTFFISRTKAILKNDRYLKKNILNVSKKWIQLLLCLCVCPPGKDEPLLGEDHSADNESSKHLCLIKKVASLFLEPETPGGKRINEFSTLPCFYLYIVERCAIHTVSLVSVQMYPIIIFWLCVQIYSGLNLLIVLQLASS